MLHMYFYEHPPLEYENNPVSSLTSHCLNKDSMNNKGSIICSKPIKVKNLEVRVGEELKMGGSAVLSKNSFGKEDSKHIYLFLKGLAKVELDYSYLSIKISILLTLSLSLHFVFLRLVYLLSLHNPLTQYTYKNTLYSRQYARYQQLSTSKIRMVLNILECSD